MIGSIILGERNFKEYKGDRFAYEWDCCLLGWSLAQLNPTLLEQKGLLQRAIHIVTSFVFKGCASRAILRTHNHEMHKAKDPALPLHEWHAHMLPRPHWLPGLAQDKHEKDRLKKLYEETLAEYERHIDPKGGNKDPKTLYVASRAAVEYYSKHVNCETLNHATDNAKSQEAPNRSVSAMNYVNIPVDPHADEKESQQLRINVPIDRVKDSDISDSVCFEGMVFMDVFDPSEITNTDLKTEIVEKKTMLEYYRNNYIGLVKPSEENLPNLRELIHQCGLSIEEYDLHWKDFKLKLNDLAFKIVQPPILVYF
jgi:hypothetical protein